MREILVNSATYFAILIGGLGTLTIIVLCLAGGANSTPQQIRRIKQVMLATLIVGAACFVGGGLLAARGQHLAGALIGLIPMIGLIGLMVWAEVTR